MVGHGSALLRGGQRDVHVHPRVVLLPLVENLDTEQAGQLLDR